MTAGKSDTWPKGAVDYVQAIADTKLILSHRYADQGFLGPNLADNIALFSLTQDEYGHVRQLFRKLETQGCDEDWLRQGRDADEFSNAATIDQPPADWLEYETRVGLTDRAALLMLDAIDHEDFVGLTDKISEEEYSHLDFHDGWLKYFAATKPDEFQAALEEILPDVLAFIGPAEYDEDTDPLFTAGFTDRSISELRETFMSYCEDITDRTSVTVPNLETFDLATWDEERRRISDRAIERETIESLQGTENQEFAAR
jgi:ring-1,2-phenylacetyl-CoA epoxidase subunit PaaC